MYPIDALYPTFLVIDCQHFPKQYLHLLLLLKAISLNFSPILAANLS